MDARDLERHVRKILRSFTSRIVYNIATHLITTRVGDVVGLESLLNIELCRKEEFGRFCRELFHSHKPDIDASAGYLQTGQQTLIRTSKIMGWRLDYAKNTCATPIPVAIAGDEVQTCRI